MGYSLGRGEQGVGAAGNKALFCSDKLIVRIEYGDLTADVVGIVA